MKIIFEKLFHNDYDFSGLKEDLETKLELDGKAVFFKTVAVQYDSLEDKYYVFHDYEIFDSMEELQEFLNTYYRSLKKDWIITDIDANVIFSGDICITADNVVARREQCFSIQTIRAL